VTTIAERWREIRGRVDAACERAKRAPSDVTIVAVSKTHPASAVREAAAAGATDFGENYAQELAAKRGECGDVRWHYIGRLQRNKAKLVAGQVALVHAVDSVELAQELGKRAAQVQPILLAVNAAGEETKGGVTAETAGALANAISDAIGIQVDRMPISPSELFDLIYGA
jgi:pyridoxal phosphate enzyme (YggS family)